MMREMASKSWLPMLGVLLVLMVVAIYIVHFLELLFSVRNYFFGSPGGMDTYIYIFAPGS